MLSPACATILAWSTRAYVNVASDTSETYVTVTFTTGRAMCTAATITLHQWQPFSLWPILHT